MVDYSLFYSIGDGKLHIAHGCKEENEQFYGIITNEVYEAEWYMGYGSTLEINDCFFETSAEMALIVPDNTTIYFRGKNVIKVISDHQDANSAVIYSWGNLTLHGNHGASLEVYGETEKGLYCRAICARRGNLTVNGGTITAIGEKARKNCGIYAGGRIPYDDEDRGFLFIISGKVSATRYISSETKPDRMWIAPGADVTNALGYSEADGIWKAHKIEPAEPGKPITISLE